ncbi:hypothetical protein R83H12_02720 [Fibrobacteria bacterium R8-3-H12]
MLLKAFCIYKTSFLLNAPSISSIIVIVDIDKFTSLLLMRISYMLLFPLKKSTKIQVSNK